jgi:transcriptional regulator with XRE-family HTH domain
MGKALAPVARAQFAKRLRAIRAQRGFARARFFAKTLGIEENRYTRYERGEVEPNLTLLLKMCQILSVTSDQLLGFAELEETVAPVGTGFAEAPDQPPLGSRSSARADPGDVVAWRLASELEAIQREAKAGPKASANPLQRVRDTGTLYRQLQADPFGTLAEVLAEPAFEQIDDDRKSALAELIETYTRSVS